MYELASEVLGRIFDSWDGGVYSHRTSRLHSSQANVNQGIQCMHNV